MVAVYPFCQKRGFFLAGCGIDGIHRHFCQVCRGQRQCIFFQNGGVSGAVRKGGGVGFFAFRGFLFIHQILERNRRGDDRQDAGKGNEYASMDISGCFLFPQEVRRQRNQYRKYQKHQEHPHKYFVEALCAHAEKDAPKKEDHQPEVKLFHDTHSFSHRQTASAGFHSPKGFFPPPQVSQTISQCINAKDKKQQEQKPLGKVCQVSGQIFLQVRNALEKLYQKDYKECCHRRQIVFPHGAVGGFQPQGFVCFQGDGMFFGGIENLHLLPLGHIVPAGFFTVGNEVLLRLGRLCVKGGNIGKKGNAVGAFFRRNGSIFPEITSHRRKRPALLCHLGQMGSNAVCIVKGEAF